MKNKLFAITGTSRAGTAYTSRCLMSSGYKIPHEQWGDLGTVSWFFATDKHSSIRGWSLNHAQKYAKEQNKELIILHQIRNPIDCISSLMTLSDQAVNWIQSHDFTNINNSDSMLVKCIKYYYYWNIRCYTIANESYTLKNSDTVLKSYFDNFNSKNISRKTNSRKHPTLSKDTIIRSDPFFGIKCFELYEKIKENEAK